MISIYVYCIIVIQLSNWYLVESKFKQTKMDVLKVYNNKPVKNNIKPFQTNKNEWGWKALHGARFLYQAINF